MQSQDSIHIVPLLFEKTCKRLDRKIAFRYKDFGLWQEISWAKYFENAREVASGLLNLGVRRGDFVGVIAENGPEWLYVDMGAQMLGATVVGIYATNAHEQVEYIIENADCKILFAEDEEQVDKFLQFRDKTKKLEKVIYWEDKGLTELQDPQLMRFEDLRKQGRESLVQNQAKIKELTSLIREYDTSILVYTSGTTGQPKGAMLTHKNLTWMAHTIRNLEEGAFLSSKEEVMSFLPLCHIFERMFSVYTHISIGYTINFAESIETVPENLREIHPTIGYAVPRIWEKFYSRIYLNMEDADWVNRKIYQLALKVAEKYQSKLEQKKQPGPLLWLGNAIAQRGVFYYLKERLGMEKMRFAFSAAAPIAPEILRFFKTIGLTMVEAYGMTETSGLITFSTVSSHKLGTVGLAIPESEVKIAEDGEIMAKHPGVFKGYYKNHEATDSVIKEGWMHTGDIGEVDGDGFYKIVDRKKDLIITAAGKNIAPQYIENKLKFSPFINDAIVIGDRRKYLTAIIVLDEENVNKFAQDNKVQYSTYADLAENADIVNLINTEVNTTNKSLARVQNIRKFKILNKRLYQEDGEVTPTMKVKRKFINETYHDLIESMY